MTRKEAIERIKARFDKWALDDEDMKAIQTLIPELTESKDEKIRKELIEFIQWSEDRGMTRHDFHQAKRPAEWIAYLEKKKDNKFAPRVLPCSAAWFEDGEEKQKESLHISETCKESADSFTDDDERIRKKLIEIIGYFRSRGIDQQLCEEFIAYLEKQKEQKPEWSEEDEKKLERVDDLLWMLDDYLGNDCSICEEKTARLRDEIHNELFPWLEFLRPQYHGDVTMTEAYKMGLEAGKASSWKPSEKQTNNVIVELTRIELGDIINGLYYLKEKYYEDCKEHNGTATMGLSDEFKFYFKRFNEVLDLYTRLHELEKEKYGTTTDGYYYE